MTKVRLNLGNLIREAGRAFFQGMGYKALDKVMARREERERDRKEYYVAVGFRRIFGVDHAVQAFAGWPYGEPYPWERGACVCGHGPEDHRDVSGVVLGPVERNCSRCGCTRYAVGGEGT